MTKYLGLLKAFFIASTAAELEYRMNILLRILGDIIWYLTQIIMFEIIYANTQNIAGWTLDETRVFLGIIFISDALYMIFFHENINIFSEKIRKGDLDLLLTKPVESQFFISLQLVSITYIPNLLIAMGWLLWSYSRLADPSYWNLLWLLLLVPCSTLVVYATRFMFATMALFLTRAENVQYLWYQIYKLGHRPDSVYPSWLRYLLISAIPMAMVASLPARIVVKNESPWLALWAIIATALFLWGSHLFWKYGLRNYTSASS